uniref:Beta-lactamase n=1 Tax=Cystobacter fuscus TaxID=43 RepID=A0A068FHE4_9BACT|nr:beta-lactamase [Cystobacter fuscus]
MSSRRDHPRPVGHSSSFLVARSWVGPVSAVVLLGACVTPAQPSPDDVSVKLQAVLDQAAAFEQSPGMVMAVQLGDSTPWIGVTGCEDEACTRKMTPEAKFRVGSITKNFVGTAILQQVDEGKVHLDDTLEKWLPGVFSHIDGNGITVRQLLNHTSGIESFTESLRWQTTVYESPTQPWNDPYELLKLADELRAANSQVLPPGSQFFYSNTNYVLLGMIAAKADGHPVTDWPVVLQERFFNRLALRDTRVPARGEVGLGSTNRGYVNFYNLFLDPATGRSACSPPFEPPCENKDVDFTEQDVSNAGAAGAIISTVGDLLTWTKAVTKGGLLSRELLRQQQSFFKGCPPAPAECPPGQIEVGLAMFRQPRYGFIGIRGEIHGFNGTIQYLPEKDLTVVVLSNRTALDDRDVGPVPESVAAALYPALKTRN